MVTLDAVRVVHDERLIGSIAVGHVADLVLFEPAGPDPYAAVVRGTPQTVKLVMRGGTILYGQPAPVDALRPGCEVLDVAGKARRLCSEAGRLSAEALVAFGTAHRLYPLAFAGEPLNEPVCQVR